MLDFNQAKKANAKLLALEALFDGDINAIQKLKAAARLAKGINSTLDKSLDQLFELEMKIQEIKKGKLGSIVADKLPEENEKQKKYKKLVVLYFSRRKQLKAETDRVRKELTKDYPKLQNQSAQQTMRASRIMRAAKGPLGLVTLVAAGLVWLQMSSAQVTIVNQGCNTIQPSSYSNIRLPGISLPQAPIVDGGQGEVKIPALRFKLTVDANRLVRVSAYGIKFDFALGNKDIDLIFNGESLLDGATELKLKSGSQNTLVVVC